MDDKPTTLESRRARFSKWMGTAFSRGNGDHLPPMRMENSLFVTETQADNLRNEVVAEVMEEEQGLWEDTEAGIVKLEVPKKGSMVRVRITGQATVYIGSDGKLNLLDPRPY